LKPDSGYPKDAEVNSRFMLVTASFLWVDPHLIYTYIHTMTERERERKREERERKRERKTAWVSLGVWAI